MPEIAEWHGSLTITERGNHDRDAKRPIQDCSPKAMM
jgi:hypothetical protein